MKKAIPDYETDTNSIKQKMGERFLPTLLTLNLIL